LTRPVRAWYVEIPAIPSGRQGDVAWVRAIADGDREALGRLYDRYAPTLMAVGVRILGDRREAEDVLHDVFLEVWRQAANYDESRGSVRTWLLMRMRSRALDRRKAAGFARVVSLDQRGDDARGVGDDPSLVPDRETVRRALADLPPEQRQVLELGYFEGLSSTEIAARVEAPVGTVKSRVAAGLGKLRATLGARGTEERE
jgi:RNA polymerase sigma-70 factor (ECF subfamily)